MSRAYTIPTMNARAYASNGDSQLNDRDVISLTVIDFITGLCLRYSLPTFSRMLRRSLHGHSHELRDVLRSVILLGGFLERSRGGIVRGSSILPENATRDILMYLTGKKIRLN